MPILWTEVLASSFNLLWQGLIAFLPTFLVALIVFVIGVVIAGGLARLVESLIDALKIDVLIEKLGAKPFFDRAGLRIDSGRFLGELLKWLVVLAFLFAATDILGLVKVSEAILSLLGYVPNIIVAALILLVTVVLANFLQRVVHASASGGSLKAANLAAAVAKWAVFITGLSAALVQLKVGDDVVKIILTGLVAMLALAGGLAFGLGGKDYASDLLERFRREVE